MPGFMSSSTAMIICQADKPAQLDIEKLRRNAFTDLVDPDGRRFGWVGLGELLDTDNFFLALSDVRFSGFSFRQDFRRPSAAAVRLQLAEKIREEEEAGKKTGARRRRELREAIVEKLTSQAEFAPSLIDCIWDNEKGRLFVAAGTEKAATPVLEHFKNTFGIETEPVAPERDMTVVFSAIQRDNGMDALGYRLTPTGDASLASSGKEKSAISTQNNPGAIENGLNDGLAITKISLEAENAQENSLHFAVDAELGVSALKLPKREKGDDEDATFLIHADICATVADIVEYLGGLGGNPEN